MMMKKLFKGCNRRILAVMLALAVMLPYASVPSKVDAKAAETQDEKVFSVLKTPTRKGAKYEYTYSDIPGRVVQVVDGQTTMDVDGSSYELTLLKVSLDATADQYGSAFIIYKNTAIYFASYEIEGKEMTLHRLKTDGKAAYGTKFLFKGTNKLMGTHYVNTDGKEVPLPTLDELRKQLGKETATPSTNPTFEPTVVPSTDPTTEPSTIPTVRPTVTPEPERTPSVEPTKRPTETQAPTQKPGSTPNIVIDSSTTTDTKIDVSFWVKKMEEGKITWDQMMEVLKVYKYTEQTKYEEVSETKNIYDEKGNLIYSITTKSGTENKDGSGTSNENSNVSGSATTKKDTDIQGGAQADIKTTSKTHTEVKDNRNSGSSKSSKKSMDHVKRSGAKIQWITASGKTKYTSYVYKSGKKKGKFKLRTIQGKKVVEGDFIKATNTYVAKLKDGTRYVINLKNYKIAKIKEKPKKSFRDKGGFLTHWVLKNGKKVSVKKLKVPKGKYGFNLNKVRYTISYKKCK